MTDESARQTSIRNDGPPYEHKARHNVMSFWQEQEQEDRPVKRPLGGREAELRLKDPGGRGDPRAALDSWHLPQAPTGGETGKDEGERTSEEGGSGQRRSS